MGWGNVDQFDRRPPAEAEAWRYTGDVRMHITRARHLLVQVDTQQRAADQHFARRVQTQIKSGQFVFVVQVGRLLALVVIMPPYFFFYSAPKWVFQKTVPHFIHVLNRTGDGLEKIYFRISAWSSDVFSIVSNRMRALLKPKQAKKRQVREKENMFKLLVKDLRPKIEQALQLWKAFKGIPQKVSQTVRSFVNKLLQPIRAPFQHIGNYLRMPFKTLGDFGAAARERLKKFQEALHARRVAIKEKFNKARETLIRKSAEFFEKTIATVTNLPQVIKTLIPTLMNPVYTFFQERINNPIKSVASVLVQPLAVVRNLAWNGMNFIRERTLNGVHLWVQMKNAASQAAEAYLRKVVQRLDGIKLHLAKQISRAMDSAQRLFTPMIKKMQQMFDQSKKHSKKKMEDLKDACIKVAIKARDTLFEQIKKMPSRFSRFFKWLLAWAWRGLKKGLRGFRRGLIWSKIILQHSFKTIWNDL